MTIYSYGELPDRGYHQVFEGKIRDELDKLFTEQLNYPLLNHLRPDRAKFGYKTVVILLGIVAFVATWLDVLFETE